jgi:hypothetical protein
MGEFKGKGIIIDKISGPDKDSNLWEFAGKGNFKADQ